MQIKFLSNILINGLYSFTHQDKLKKTNFFTLGTRRIEHQPLIMFKMRYETNVLDFEDFLKETATT